MTVVYTQSKQAFTAYNALWNSGPFAKAIVEQVLLSQTEAHIEMIIDCQEDQSGGEDELTRTDIQATLANVKQTAKELLADLMADLQTTIMTELENASYGACVTGIKYGLAGDVQDIEVDITIS